MEIVRQRKKRLLAWILTLVLCVGLWQGNAQASDVTGGMPSNEPKETGIFIESNAGKIDEFKQSVTYSISKGDTTEETTIETDCINNINSNSSLIVVGKTILGDDTGQEYEHKLLKWEVVDSNNKILDSKTREEDFDINTITPPNSTQEQIWSWDNVAYLKLTWGKVLVVTHHIMSGETETGSEKKPYYQRLPEQTDIEIDLPQVEDIFKDGKFVEWIDTISSGNVIGSDRYTIEFGNSYEEQNLYEEQYLYIEKSFGSTKVPRSGTYTLLLNEMYVLGNTDERWTVTSGTQSDGYEYVGGISFVGSGVECTYTKK